MRLNFSSIVSLTQLLTIAAALPAGNDDIVTPAEKTYEPVDLEFGKTYTTEDLQQLFDAQGSTPAGHADTAQTKRSNPKDGPVSTNLAQKPIDFIGSVAFSYRVTCAHGPPMIKQYKLLATYDGKQIFWDKNRSLNIDGWGKTTTSGGNGHPIYTTAEYHHGLCKGIDPYTICSWYHFGVGTAQIRVGTKDAGMMLSTIEPRSTARDQVPYVIQTCSRRIPGGVAIPCPKINFDRPRCKIDQFEFADEY